MTVKSSIGFDHEMDEASKEKWKIYLKARTDLHQKIRGIQDLLTDIDKFLYPILEILEDEDIPVQSVHWDQSIFWYKNITLKNEMKLTEKAYDRIMALFPDLIDEDVEKTIEKSFVTFDFQGSQTSFQTPGPLKISNGEGTCKVIAVENFVHQPAAWVKKTTLEVANGCSGIELGKGG